MNIAIENLFRLEAEAVIDAHAAIRRSPERFETMALKLASIQSGKLLVTGVGKSAIAARKIAATLATCTIPAIFIDPIGLFHGELGAISERDIALLISNSGETEELVRLVPALMAKKVDVMSIVGDGASTLGQLPFALYTNPYHPQIPQIIEAFGRLPTCSFVATVALGDALAIRAAQMKDVSLELMAENHPGGTIGRERTIER